MKIHDNSKYYIWIAGLVGAAAGGMLLSGCKGVPTRSERQSQTDLKSVTQIYRPGNRKVTLPTLRKRNSRSSSILF